MKSGANPAQLVYMPGMGSGSQSSNGEALLTFPESGREHLVEFVPSVAETSRDKSGGLSTPVLVKP